MMYVATKMTKTAMPNTISQIRQPLRISSAVTGSDVTFSMCSKTPSAMDTVSRVVRNQILNRNLMVDFVEIEFPVFSAVLL